jgi:hypothetical protein
MNPRNTSLGRLSAFAPVVLVSLATFAALGGCSNRPQEIVGPSRSSAELAATSEPSRIVAAPIEQAKYPRIRIWTDDGWRQFQKVGGVSLQPDRIYNLDVPELKPVTLHWLVQPQGQSRGTRWAVDIYDIVDDTPRSGPGDVAHWSTWSTSDEAASVGPFASGGADSVAIHWFYVEARDNNGFLSLLTVRMRVIPASEGAPEAIKRR